MTSKEFVYWMKGFAVANSSLAVFNQVLEVIETVSDPLPEVEFDVDNWKTINRSTKPKDILND